MSSDKKFLPALQAKIHPQLLQQLLAALPADTETREYTPQEVWNKALTPEARDRIKIACDLAQQAIDEWATNTGKGTINRDRARQLDAFAVRLGHLAVVGLERAFWETIAEVAGDVLYVLIRQAQM